MKTKIRKIGNSMGVIIPKEVQKEAELKLGDNVAVLYSPSESTVVIGKEEDMKVKSPITPEFYNWLKNFNKKYKKALTELAKK